MEDLVVVPLADNVAYSLACSILRLLFRPRFTESRICYFLL